jgi:hypothetical protein
VIIWLLLLIMLLVLGLSAGLWIMVQFALISDDTREEICGEACNESDWQGATPQEGPSRLDPPDQTFCK